MSASTSDWKIIILANRNTQQRKRRRQGHSNRAATSTTAANVHPRPLHKMPLTVSLQWARPHRSCGAPAGPPPAAPQCAVAALLKTAVFPGLRTARASGVRTRQAAAVNAQRQSASVLVPPNVRSLVSRTRCLGQRGRASVPSSAWLGHGEAPRERLPGQGWARVGGWRGQGAGSDRNIGDKSSSIQCVCTDWVLIRLADAQRNRLVYQAVLEGTRRCQ